MADLHRFYRGKRVLVTGHTGFKGAWLCATLAEFGANVTGYSLAPPTQPSLFELTGLGTGMHSVFGDIRDLASLRRAVSDAQPDIIFHLAAQPIVREGYKNPLGTYETNVMGTLYLLECVRTCKGVRSLVNVTTDKVYRNNEWPWGYREIDTLDGYDPYSNSKSCSELITASYMRSFFSGGDVAISTARAGNVLGGGDFATDRILPDCIRAALSGKPALIRNPNSIRPYQHVLDAISAYLLLAKAQAEDASLSGSYNIGPDDSDCMTSGALAKTFCAAWGEGQQWISGETTGPHEAGFLRLDSSKIRANLGWRPRWNAITTVEKTVAWFKAYQAGDHPAAITKAQIQKFFDERLKR